MTDFVPPRVLFVGAFPPPERQMFGGMVTSCRALLQSSLPGRLRLDLLDSTQISNPVPGFLVRLVLAARRCCRYVIRFERHKPDCVLLFVAVGASVAEKGAMAWYARLRGVPAIMFPRGGGLIDACRSSRSYRWWVRLAFGGARIMFCQSQTWQRFAGDTLGFAPQDAPVIQNWTATPELLRIGRSRRAPNRARPTRLLFLGWLDREKGVGELLRVCKALSAGRRFTLDVAGEGSFSKQARDFVDSNELDSTVRFHGWLHGAALLQMLAQSDVLVLPSWVEGLPNAMIEAMAAGLAVIVSAVGGIPDIMTHERDALLVPPRDVDALTAAVTRIVEEEDLQRRLAAAGLDLAEREFGVERAVELMVRAVTRVTTPATSSKLAQSPRVE